MERQTAGMRNDASPTTVLLVDDEPAIREFARRTLESRGYQVIDAGNGLEAIEILSHGVRLDLLIADLEMPELSGVEMVRRIRAVRPDLKVLYVTGHIDLLMDARPLWEGEAFLEKPFSANALLEAVALILYGTLTRPSSEAIVGAATAGRTRNQAR